MATTYTPNYNLAQPEVGGEPDTWGGLLNVNFGTLDTQLKSVSNVANAAVVRAGDTMSGNLIINRTGSNSASLSLQAASGNNRNIYGSTGGSARWELQLGNSAGETGGNAGSDFSINRYNDSGAYIGTPVNISRATGVISLNSATVVNAGFSTVGGSITSGGDVVAVQNFLSSTGNVVLAPNGNGAVLIRPQGGSSTGQTQFGVTDISTSVPIIGTASGAAPSSPNMFAFRASGSFGGGYYLNDPGGALSWGIYTASGALNFASGSVNGGSLTSRVSVSSSGVVSASDFTATSDRRLKSELEDIEGAAERLRAVVPRLYVKDGRREAGVIAQEVQAVFAPAVSEGWDGYLRVSHGQLQALVIAAVRELDARLKAVEEAL